MSYIADTPPHHCIDVIPSPLFYVIPAKAGIQFATYRFPIKSGMTSVEYKKIPGITGNLENTLITL